MKINELIGDFQIFTTHEDRHVLTKLSKPTPLQAFSERDQVVIENLIRKGLVIKCGQTNIIVVKNEL
jgi:hypothetical protein